MPAYFQILPTWLLSAMEVGTILRKAFELGRDVHLRRTYLTNREDRAVMSLAWKDIIQARYQGNWYRNHYRGKKCSLHLINMISCLSSNRLALDRIPT